MWYAFFALAAQSPTRQRSFRKAVITHLLVLAAGAWLIINRPSSPALLGHLLLVTGIIEGAALLGWRLTQLPRSQALEFLLVSSLRPGSVLVAEALVGIARLALVTVAGLPVLLLLVGEGHLALIDLWPLLVMPFTWGTVTGLGLAMWAYEPQAVRRTAERIVLGSIILYVGVGVVAGERLLQWINWLPRDLGRWFLGGFEAFHHYNPFGVLDFWFKYTPSVAGARTWGLELAALLGIVLMLTRAAARLKGHFHDRHYRPVVDASRGRRGHVGDHPLSWWAVRRVREYSGRINLWLAGGFGVAYALFTVAGPYWPPWMGQRVFLFFERAGGIPVVCTALIVLAAVPAAFQYGLWDSNAQDRCRRLELLLLTELEPRDYWRAAAAAAWRRGRGYFAIALLLWVAAAVAGRVSLASLIAAPAAGIILWGLYFTLGFGAFARGLQANGLGMVLTVGVPLLVIAASWAGWSVLACLLPPGAVYEAAESARLASLLGTLLSGLLALTLARAALARCDRQLRRWYEGNHGCKVLD